MRGRLVHAPVPHEPACPRWLSPAYLVGNAAVYALNVGPCVTARVSWGVILLGVHGDP